MTDIQPTRETGATNLEIFRIREELSSGYRGGVKIDLDFTFIAQCEIPMFPFVIFFYGILHPDSHADVESISKFSHTLCLHPFALGR